jgi:hypothetical protein
VKKWSGSVSTLTRNVSREGFNLVIDDIGAYQDGEAAAEGVDVAQYFRVPTMGRLPSELDGRRRRDGRVLANLEGKTDAMKTEDIVPRRCLHQDADVLVRAERAQISSYYRRRAERTEDQNNA